MRRYLARHVVADGADMGLCLVSITKDGKVDITPFQEETPGTVYLDGMLEVRTCDGHILSLLHNGKPLKS